MKKSTYLIIICLLGFPAGLMIGLQTGTLMRQYQRSLENFKTQVTNTVSKTQQIFSTWVSHTSNEQDKQSYNLLYTNKDSSFSFMIAQSAQPYPLLDFKPDTFLPKLRKEQFLRFKEELEKTRLKDNPRLKEFYVFRTIQYCKDCAEKQLSIAQIFPIDSLIKSQLKVQKITTEVEIGFYDTKQKKWRYLTNKESKEALEKTAYRFPFNGQEELRLHFPHLNSVLLQNLTTNLIGSCVLIVISLTCYIWAARILHRQKKLSEMKNDFINNVTHEFKTPISTITFALANIENEQVIQNPEAIKQFTKVIKDENKRLNTQVEKVLQTTLIDQKALELKKEMVDMHQIIRNLSEAYTLKLGEKDKIQLQLNAPHPAIKVDIFHLSNAISNLLDNALKYSNPPIEITIQTENKDKSLIIKVIDNGIGISKEQQSLIFEKFYRVPTGNLHNVKGFGLGLSYVKAIVESHKGRIHLQSRLQKGSTFTIELPLNE